MLNPALIERLTSNEKKALEEWLEARDRRSLSPVTSAKFYELYLHGESCSSIVQLNENLYSLGMLVEAKVRDGWDVKKDLYIAELFTGISDRVKQAQIESVAFVVDLLAVANKKMGAKAKRYLQSGDEADLKDLPVDSLSAYQRIVELLLKLTGQNATAKEGAGNKIQVIAQNAAIKTEAGVTMKTMDSDVAEQVLALLESKK